jgi:hypothetical protein
VRHATLFPPFLRARAVHAAPFVRKFSRHKLPVQVAATIPSPPPSPPPAATQRRLRRIQRRVTTAVIAIRPKTEYITP